MSVFFPCLCAEHRSDLKHFVGFKCKLRAVTGEGTIHFEKCRSDQVHLQKRRLECALLTESAQRLPPSPPATQSRIPCCVVRSTKTSPRQRYESPAPLGEQREVKRSTKARHRKPLWQAELTQVHWESRRVLGPHPCDHGEHPRLVRGGRLLVRNVAGRPLLPIRTRARDAPRERARSNQAPWRT